MCVSFPVKPDKMTSTEKIVAEYIVEHKEEILFLTIGQLASTLNISEATISRFVRHVGCKNFKHLKQVVMEQTVQKGAAQKLANTLLTGEGDLLENWMEQQQYNLQKTLELMSKSEFDRASRTLAEAHRVFIYAKNASRALAQLLEFRLRRLGIDVHLMPSGGTEILEGLAHVCEDDVVILFGFSKVSTEGRMILDYQRTVGYTTILFTGLLYPKEEQEADIHLFVYRGEENAYHSMSAATAIVDALVLATSDYIGADAVTSLDRIRMLKNKYALKMK